MQEGGRLAYGCILDGILDGGASDDVTYQPICRPTATAQGRAGQGRSGQTVLPCCPTSSKVKEGLGLFGLYSCMF